jgi:hypothetical protein
VNEIVRVELSVTTPIDVPQLKIRLKPELVEIFKGEETLLFEDLHAFESREYSALLRVNEPGEHRLRFYVQATSTNGHLESNNYFLFFLTHRMKVGP